MTRDKGLLQPIRGMGVSVVIVLGMVGVSLTSLAAAEAPPVCKDFPIILPGSGGAIKVGDLVGNGAEGGYELILTGNNSNEATTNYIHVFDASGNYLPGWPRTEARPGVILSGQRSPVALGDFDPDTPGDEILVGCADSTPTSFCRPHVYRSDASLLEGWPPATDLQNNTSTSVSPVIFRRGPATAPENLRVAWSSINSDQQFDPTTTARLFVFDGLGQLVDGWPTSKTAGGTFGYSSPIVADVDNSGTDELIVMLPGPEVHAYKNAETEADGWPYINEAGLGTTSPVAGDVDRDGDIEIVYISGLPDGRIQIEMLDHKAAMVPGFPVIFDANIFRYPVLGDIDADGDLEIVLTTFEQPDTGAIRIFHHTGDEDDASPIALGDVALAAPTLADLDNDLDLEIAVGAYDSHAYVFHHDGTPYDGFPQPMVPEPKLTAANRSAVVADLDGDGDVELLMPTLENFNFEEETRVLCWDFPGKATGPLSWPSDRADDSNHATVGANYVPSTAAMLLAFALGIVIWIYSFEGPSTRRRL